MKFSYIMLELSSRCYAGCAGCFRSYVDVSSQADMSREIFEAALLDVDRGTMICPALHGESMLHPDYPYFIRRFKALGLPVSTPASGLVRHHIPLIAHPDSPVYTCVVSCDGFTPYSQGQHRGNITLKAVEGFIDDFLATRKGNYPTLGIRWTQNGQSEAEFEAYLKYWLFIKKVDLVIRATHFDYGSKNNSPQLLDKCKVITKNIPAVTSTGDVLLCERVPDREKYVLGNVLHDSWNTIFERRDSFVSDWPYCEPCKLCSASVVDTGFQGVVSLRSMPDAPIYMHSDFYQTFYSLTKKWSGITWQ